MRKERGKKDFASSLLTSPVGDVADYCVFDWGGEGWSMGLVNVQVVIRSDVSIQASKAVEEEEEE